MAKTRSARTSFVCRECGNVQPKWMGKCPDCGAWDGLQKFVEAPPLPGELPNSG
ncbi:MAG: DNA repair protein RadA, partial [Phycisphaerae bacterium]|nr:DNA repair protein RadA [Phycisphaerae bacterium]